MKDVLSESPYTISAQIKFSEQGEARKQVGAVAFERADFVVAQVKFCEACKCANEADVFQSVVIQVQQFKTY